MKRLFLLIWLLASCAHISERAWNPINPITPYGEFQLHVETFVALMQQRTSYMLNTKELIRIIWHRDMPFNIYATCRFIIGPLNRPIRAEIWVNYHKLYFRSTKPIFDVVLYHELAHCLTGAQHSTKDGLMQPQIDANITKEEVYDMLMSYVDDLAEQYPKKE
jgi:hypothetical protein